MEILFWFSLFVVIYTYIGYGFLLYFLIRLKRAFQRHRNLPVNSVKELPSCTVVVAAYNEERDIEKKIENTLSLQYPREKIQYIFVTDGSTDRTPELVSKYSEILHLHQETRAGKVAAIERAMKQIDSDIVVFTDANTFLNKGALLEICQAYTNPKVGAVAGEKRVSFEEEADASAAGEGFYWKYESTLKKWDSELYSVVGSAGELFSIRRVLYEEVPADTILDDFMISMRVAAKGYLVQYVPEAYAIEQSSANVKEELKRKIRIAAGGMQSIVRLPSLLNPIPFPWLTFQYISHRVLRWTITPLCLVLVFFSNAYLAYFKGSDFYSFLLLLQIVFYILAISGWLLENKSLRVKIAFIPYYFCVMNYAVVAGIIRFFQKKQSAVWVRAQRRN